MKKILLLLLLFVNALTFGQSINNYKYLVMSKRYSFQDISNEYRLNSNARFILKEQGFNVLFDDETLPDELALDNCKAMYLDMIAPDELLTTKLTVVFRDCHNKILFACQEGVSKEKQRSAAFNEALVMSLESVKELNYKYNGGTVAVTSTASTSKTDADNILSAIPIANGFQLKDEQNKTVITIFKTSNKDCFIATMDGIQGVLILKDYQWFFEYYIKNQFYSDKVKVAF